MAGGYIRVTRNGIKVRSEGNHMLTCRKKFNEIKHSIINGIDYHGGYLSGCEEGDVYLLELFKRTKTRPRTPINRIQIRIYRRDV